MNRSTSRAPLTEMRSALILLVAFASFPSLSLAGVFHLDLPDLSGDETVNGARFLQEIPSTATGSGTFDPFLAIGGSPTEVGYNHGLPNSSPDAPILDEDLSKTSNITLGLLPVVTLDGNQYIELLLDAGEPGGNGKQVLNLVELQLFTTDTPDQVLPDPAGGVLALSSATLRYDLDGNEDNTVVLDGSLSPGNGKRDLNVYFPLSSFVGATASDYVVLFSQFSEAESTFEEWGYDPQRSPTFADLPEPSSFVLLLLGGCLAGLRLRIE